MVLWQFYGADAGGDVGFILLDPQQFRCRESGQHRFACQCDASLSSDAIMDLITFIDGALVVPEDGWAKDGSIVISKYQPVHLAGEGDGLDQCRGFKFIDDAADRRCRGRPPEIRILFRPKWVRGFGWPCVIRSVHNVAAAGVDQQDADAAGADIDAENQRG